MPPQSLTFSIDGQEVEVTERAYSDLLNENKGLREELDSLRSGESEERDARDARVRWVQDDRAGALDILIGYAEEAGDASELYSSYAVEYQTDLLNQAEELVSAGRHDEAVDLLRDGATHLADSSSLETRADQIEASAPVPLRDIALSDSRYFKASDVGQLTDTVGNSYPGDSSYVMWESGESGNGYADFHLGGAYSSLDGTIAVATDSYQSSSHQASGVLEVRVRDEGGEYRTVYASPVLTRSTEPIRLGDTGNDRSGLDWMEIAYYDKDGAHWVSLNIILSGLTVSGS